MIVDVIDVNSINSLPMEAIERVDNSIIYNIYGLESSEPCLVVVYKVSPKHYIFL